MPDITETLIERGKTHGDSVYQFNCAQDIKMSLRQGIRWKDLTRHEREAIETIATKLSRIVSGNPHEPDHWLDISGYATLVHKELTK